VKSRADQNRKAGPESRLRSILSACLLSPRAPANPPSLLLSVESGVENPDPVWLSLSTTFSGNVVGLEWDGAWASSASDAGLEDHILFIACVVFHSPGVRTRHPATMGLVAKLKDKLHHSSSSPCDKKNMIWMARGG
jgi:hypothetical protein